MAATWLAPRFDTIPPELHALGGVLWRAEPRDGGKAAKVPYCVAAPTRKASSTDPATWATFADAADAYSVLADLPADPVLGPVAGVGVVLTQAAGVTCVDLDNVIDEDGRLDGCAATVVQRCDSWTERSPGGRGLHVFVLGGVPEALKGAQLEIYSTARYIAITGQRWPDTPADVRGAQAYLDALTARARENARPRRPYSGPQSPPPDDLAGALLAKLSAWGVPVAQLKRWQGGFLVELAVCPWADEHSTGSTGAAVMIHPSGALDFTCLHAHCAGRGWREFREAMETAR